ncbi:MAG TPA: hypothetical protein VI796_04045 [Candidatus Thermoplasmatota archaeon]|nr:hypothetical protein [Candidatus Thermoplasmatota archaeon]
MREVVRRHLPAVSGFALMAVLALTLSALFPVPAGSAWGSGLPVGSILLPLPALDRDLDSYADESDLTDGDLVVRVRLDRLRLDGSEVKPYVVVGTQDDHFRTGEGAELAWRHVVDYDPLGRRAGSPSWQSYALRGGAWWVTEPGEGLDLGVAAKGRLRPDDVPDGTTWPQSLYANVRDDRPVVTLRVELWNAAGDPDSLADAWDLEFQVQPAAFRIAGAAEWTAAGSPLVLGDVAEEGEGAGLGLTLQAATDIAHADKELLAQRWTPILRFDSGEAFYPVPGDVLQRLYGFGRPQPDLRTWELSFNDGRDAYNLFLADYDGNRKVDHHDAAALSEGLMASGAAPATVYANVQRTTNDKVVVQYWFLYFYNFVLDEASRDVEQLVHQGDREFVQLTFRSLEAAKSGMPESASFSQHYGGLRLTGLSPDRAPFEGGRLVVYPAGGSHASYPVAGDDRRLRPAFSGVYDRFDGDGTEWMPQDYRTEVLGNQEWHMGYLWGPVTRYGRDLGVSFHPLLQHDFRYPYTDPLHWERSLTSTDPSELTRLYGESS